MALEEVGFPNAESSKTKDGGQGRFRNVGRSICNTEKGEFLGRTASSWAKISVFYIIFYSCLAGFFAIMLVGFFATLDENAPTQQKMYSLIKANPGMGFRPLADIDTTLIQFTAGKPDTYSKILKSIDGILKVYREPQNGTVIDCITSERKEDEVCKVDMTEFGPCTEENEFGYRNGTPCVLLKLNRVFDWVPQPLSNDSDLSEEVQKRYNDAKKILGDRVSDRHVGVSCEGENDGDVDNIGEVEFFPKDGFPFSFYPYKKQIGYLSPLVFVQFKNVEPGALIQVWCKMWAGNIKHHKNDKAGSTHFELLMDKQAVH